MLEALEKLIEELDKGDENRDTFDDLVLAEILWLAHTSDAFQKAKKEKTPSEFSQWLKNLVETIKALFQKKSQTSSNDDSTSIQKIRLPKKKDSFISNALIEALAPLQKPFVSSYESQEVDEVATVDYVARTNIIQPVFKAKNENYYDLYLLVDIGKSMTIWEETVHVFVEKLKIYNYFRSIKVFYLDSQELDAPIYTTKRKNHKISLHLSNSDGHALMFVISDFIAPAWRKGDLLFKIFERNEKVPVSLINMLPKRMWHGTILANTNFTKVHNPKKVFKANFVTSDIDDEYDEKLYKLPIVNFSLDEFDDLSHFIIGSKENGCTALVATKEEIFYREEEKIVALTAQERVQRFFENSSYEAHELALYFSITTHLNFEIMKMIQHNMMPNSEQIHLAEVFVGGLIDKSSHGKFYSFIQDQQGICVRDILLERLGDYQAMATLKKNSEFIAQNLGSSLDFMALLYGDFNKAEWSKEDEAFAEIASSVFDKIGGSYSKIASKIKVYEEDEHNWQSPLPPTPTITPLTKRYQMGSEDGRDNEKSLHEVTINYDFEIAQTPVTVGEFRAFVEATGYRTEAEKGDGAYVWDGKNYDKKKDASWKNPYFQQTDEHPVVCVSWNDAQAYIKWLNEETNKNYRLPTEAEWEFACRAGTTTKWSFGDDAKELNKYVWYYENSENRTQPVATKEPNPWELYDMHGNVWEWCMDDYVDNYENTPQDGSVNTQGEKKYKSLRGGSWFFNGYSSRSAYRFWLNPTGRVNSVGFRILRTLS